MVDGGLSALSRGIGWATGSIPIRILLALSASFSQARASSCSATTEVRWGGVGRLEESRPACSRDLAKKIFLKGKCYEKKKMKKKNPNTFLSCGRT